jgi:glycosyltransferase involved in cell wall biosynthesis
MRPSDCPKISIIVPSFNQGAFLERTILSIINQNYPDLELIVIDGGSTDESLATIKKYEKYIAYWVSEKDRGQSDALNKGFKMAKGEIAAYQNSDDVYLPGSFEKVIGLFRQSPRAEIIYGNRFDIDKDDKIIGKSIFTKFSPLILEYEGIVLGSQSTFWRTEVFSKIGYFDENLHLAMDYDFFLRAAVKNIRFKRTAYYLGAMRRHSSSKTEMFSGKPPHTKECEEIAKKYGKKDFLNIPMRIYSIIYRTINYLMQGDWAYVFSGLIRRFKGKFYKI